MKKMTVKSIDKKSTLLLPYIPLTPLIGEQEQFRPVSKGFGVSSSSESDLCHLLCGPSVSHFFPDGCPVTWSNPPHVHGLRKEIRLQVPWL